MMCPVLAQAVIATTVSALQNAKNKDDMGDVLAKSANCEKEECGWFCPSEQKCSVRVLAERKNEKV